MPPVEGRTIKASTFSFRKWAWTGALSDDVVHLRASFGRAREEADLQRDDADLVAVAVAEIGEALGRPLPRVVDAHVQRWGGGLPQYAVGHVDRVASIRADVARLPGIEVAGAVYDGVGIPAVVASATRAARATVQHLSTRVPHRRSPRMSEPTRSTPAKPGAARIREVNDTIRYAMWSVFAVAEPLGGEDRDALATEVEELFTDLAERDVVVRGTYDVAGLRADADVMVWWHAETIEALQEAYHALLRTELRPAPRPGVVGGGAAPPGRVQQEPHPGLHVRRGPARLRVRLPVRALLRLVPHRRPGAPRHARRARQDGARLPRRAGQHHRLVRAQRLRVDPRRSRPTSCTASST